MLKMKKKTRIIFTTAPRSNWKLIQLLFFSIEIFLINCEQHFSLKQEHVHICFETLWISFKISQKVNLGFKDVNWSYTKRINAPQQGGSSQKSCLPEARRRRDGSVPNKRRVERRVSKMPVHELSDKIPQYEGKKNNKEKKSFLN